MNTQNHWKLEEGNNIKTYALGVFNTHYSKNVGKIDFEIPLTKWNSIWDPNRNKFRAFNLLINEIIRL